MYYLIFPPDSVFSISFGVQFISFSSFEGAEDFRNRYKCNAFITDTFPFILSAANKDGV